MNETVISILHSLPSEIVKHSLNVAQLCQQFAEPFELSRELLFTCGLFHDIGKLQIPEKILNKPVPLTKYEFEIVKKHTLYGYYMLKEAGAHEMVCLSALYHHERLNGTGYWKKKKNEIPMIAQIVAVVDVYEACTSYRPYRFPKNKKAVLKLLKDPELFNKDVVNILEDIVRSGGLQ